MSFFEKFFPETRRFRIFLSLYFLLFLTLISTLFFRQVIENDHYLEKERKQGQRRIVKPGARGDVLDRSGNLLIGNRAHYSANLHLELLNEDIWEHKLRLRRISQTLKDQINQLQQVPFETLLNLCFQEEQIQKRKIKVSGKKGNKTQKVIFSIDSIRQNVKQNGFNWSVVIDYSPNNHIEKIFILEAEKQIFVTVAGLFTIEYALNEKGQPISQSKKQDSKSQSFFSLFINEKSNPINFSTNGYSLSCEAR